MYTVPSLTDPYILAQLFEARGLLNQRGILTFGCACCRHIWQHLPSVAQDALCVAEAYLGGDVSDEQLTATRVQLWTFLGHNSCDFALKEVNAVRAVICCLYPVGPENEPHYFYTSIECILDFCNAVETNEQLQVKHLYHIFGGDSATTGA